MDRNLNSSTWRSKIPVLLGLIALSILSHAQVTSAKSRLETVEANMSETGSFSQFPFESIGPTIMSGRVTDIEGNPSNPNEFFVAYASGGVWYSKNGGMSFVPVFDGENTLTVGDIAVRWSDPIDIWVGTGEVNSSRSSYAGTGLFRSTDTGRTWTHLGLEESHHIGRIILDDNDAEKACVAVMGHLYTTNKERGIYYTSDGGKSWEQSLYINDSTGGIDIVKGKQGELFAATWERMRKAWNFDGDGEGSGVYRSTDNGQNWEKISSSESGFPEGSKCGRIGLAYDKNLNRLYAIIDNQEIVPDPDAKEPVLSPKVLKDKSLEELLDVSEEDWEVFLNRFDFPEDLSPEKLKSRLQKGSLSIEDLIRYAGINANENLFDTEIKGAELYAFEEGNWVKTHDMALDGVFYTYGYYFGQVRTDPFDPAKLYVLGVPLIYSTDTGKTFKRFDAGQIHADHHDLWLNPNLQGHMISGNDGGLNISYDGGEEWNKANPIPVGQFYTVAVDNGGLDYNVFGGLQDNGVWTGSADYEYSSEWLATGRYPYQSIMGGDGMQIAVDPGDNQTVYTGYQFGNYYRIHMATEDYSYITPQHELGESAYRWNWQTPIHLSVHHPDFLYMGSQYFHRSMDRGDSFERMSEDLTNGGIPGNVPYGTLTTIDESPLQFGLIYTGSDDGRIYRTEDLGNTWKDISGLADDLWVSRVEASNHDLDRLYVALNGYRNDDFAAYLYRSDDQGDSYNFIGQDLPAEPINVVMEDPVNESILYVGTDHGLYISTDMGASFDKVNNTDLPSAPVHDLTYADEAQHLVIGTHGRSIYRADISFLQQLPSLMDSLAEGRLIVVFEDSIAHNADWGSRRWDWSMNEGPMMDCWIYAEQLGPITITLFNASGDKLNEWTMDSETTTLTQYRFELSIDPKIYPGKKKDPLPEAAENGMIYPSSGDYQIRFSAKDIELEYPLFIVVGEGAEESGPNPDKKP